MRFNKVCELLEVLWYGSNSITVIRSTDLVVAWGRLAEAGTGVQRQSCQEPMESADNGTSIEWADLFSAENPLD